MTKSYNSSPARTRSSSQGYKTCRNADVQNTLVQLDRVAMGVKNHEGEEGIKLWTEWKEKGILTDLVGNSLVKLCEMIGISEKTTRIDEVFEAIGDKNPALKNRIKLWTYGSKTSMKYKFNTKFDKTVKTAASVTPKKKKKPTAEDGWTTVSKTAKKKTPTKKLTYDTMNSDIEDDGNTTTNNVVEPDQEAKAKDHGTEDGTQKIIDRASTDVRNYFDTKFKEDNGPKDKVENKETVITVDDEDPPPIKTFDKDLSETMTRVGNDLANKYTSKFEQKTNDKLTHMLIDFEKKLDTIIKTTMEGYHKTPEFKKHEDKILNHIDSKVGNQFNTRLGLQFKKYTEDFDQASKAAKHELRESTSKLQKIKAEYATMKTKFETSKVTLLDTVRQEMENIGDDTICTMLNQKDMAIMDINSELQEHQDNLQLTARKVESMAEEMERLEKDMQNLNQQDTEEIVIAEDDMDEDEKEMRSGKFRTEYWKLPHDDLYLKFIDGQIEDGKPLYENCGNEVYVRVADVKERQVAHGKKESTKPSTAKTTLFPQAEKMMGKDLGTDMNKEDIKPKVTPEGSNYSKSQSHISTPDGQGGTTQLFSFDYYDFPKGHTRRLDTFKAGKVTLTEVSSASQIISLYMQLQHNLTQHGILLPLDPNNIERWESQNEPPTVPYTLDDFGGDKAKYQHIRTHSATTIYSLIKETIDDDWIQGQNILLTEEQRCDGYALLYRLLALTMPKLRDIDDIHSLKEPIYTTSDTPVTFANKIGIWRQQKHYENEHMTESNCFTYLITRVPRELYEEGLTSIEKTYARYKSDHNHWSIQGKYGQEPIYPRLCKLSEAGATIMNVQIAHNVKTGKTDAIVRKATSTQNIHPTDQCMECVMDQSDNTPSFVPVIHAATARALARPRQDVVCRACKQWGHCIELGGQCDFLAQSINCQHYIKNCKDRQKLKDAVLNYDDRQKDRRRIMAKTGNEGQTTTRGTDTTQPQRGRTFERSRSPYSQRRPRTPSSVRGIAKTASGDSGTSVTFKEDDMPYGFDDSNVLFADDDSYYDEGSQMGDENQE